MEQLDADAKFGDDRVRRIIINGLRPEYNSFIAALQGWPKQPSLVELENLLANQEALAQQMSKVTIKPEVEEALFSAKRPSHRYKRDTNKEHRKAKCSHCGHESNDDSEKDSDKDEHHMRQGVGHKKIECYICGRKGHYARDCRFKKNVHNNFTKTNLKDDASEEEWDFEATYAVEEDVSEEEEVWDFEPPYETEEDASVDEWDLTEYNLNDMWIEDLESGEGFEITASYETMDQGDKEYDEDIHIKSEDEHEEKESLGLGQGDIKLMTAQPCAQEMMVNQGEIKYELTDLTEVKRSDTRREEKSTKQMVQKLGERNKTYMKARSSDEFHEKMEKTSNSDNTRKAKEQLQKNYAVEANMKIQGQLIQRRPYDRDTHDKYDIGAGIKRPPREGDQLGIEGEY